MKRILKMLGKIIVYITIYLFSQICLAISTGIYYVARYHNTKTSETIQAMMIKNVYITTLVAAIMALIIYVLIFRNKDRDLWQRCEFKKIDLKSVSLIICATISISFMTCSFILITQNIKDIPFDFTHLRHYDYQDNAESFKIFGKKLKKEIIPSLLKDPDLII